MLEEKDYSNTLKNVLNIIEYHLEDNERAVICDILGKHYHLKYNDTGELYSKEELEGFTHNKEKTEFYLT